MRTNDKIIAVYFDNLAKECETGLAKQSTVLQRKKAVKYFAGFMDEAHINIKNINSSHIHDFLQFLTQKRTIQGKKLASATIKQIYALARSFYLRCYEEDIVTKHPDLIFTRSLLRRYKLGERKLPKYINQEKMKKLLENSPERWKALLYIMYETGARINEVLSIQMHHLDFNQQLVKIIEPKTMNIRMTNLSLRTIGLLKKYISEYRPVPKKGHETYVFINHQRRRMNPRAVQYLVKRLSTRILGERSNITPHYFRAACAVHLLERGVDIRQVQEIIGWKSLAVVQNYTRVTPQLQAKLKKQFHPSFNSSEEEADPRQKAPTKQTDLIEVFRLQLEKEHLERQEEIREIKKTIFEEREELKSALRNEKQTRLQERQIYEQRIEELLKTQQKLIQMLTDQGKES